MFQKSLGGQPHKASQILTFPLSKASPGAYRSYIKWIMCLVLLLYACDVLCTRYSVLG
jgi:hypothetical protein